MKKFCQSIEEARVALIKEVDKYHKEMTSSEGQHFKSIEFVNNSKCDASQLGFLALNGIVPSDFVLEMVSLLPEMCTGSRIGFAVQRSKKKNSIVDSFLKFYVEHEGKPVEISTDKSPNSSFMIFSFEPQSYGQYIISTTLYGHHVLGSPLIVPIVDDIQTKLKQ